MKKRLLALFLAAMLVMSFGTAAMADGGEEPVEPAGQENTAAPEVTEDLEPTENVVPTESVEPTESVVPTENVEPTEEPEPTEVVTADAVPAAEQTADKVQLHLVGEGIAYVSDFVQEGPPYSAYSNGAAIRTDKFIYGVVKAGYALKAEGASAEPDTGFYHGGYDVNITTGEVTRVYRVMPDGSGDVTLTAVEATEKAPVPWHVTYEGLDAAYKSPNKRVYYELDEFFYVELNPGYAARVNGGSLQSPMAEVRVGEDGKEAVVEAVKLASGAKLAVSGEASALVDSSVFNIPDNQKTTYLLPDSTITNGSCYILLKGDYAVTDFDGGTVSFIDAISDGPGCDVYKSYYIQAQADTVTVTVEKAEKSAGWLSLVPIDDYLSQVKISNDSNFWFGGPFEGQAREFYGYISTPEREDIMTVTLEPNREGASVKGFTLDVEGGSFQVIENPDSKVFLIKVNEGVMTVVARVALENEPSAQVPGGPTADEPGLTDQAGTEKQLKEQANAMVDSALKGQTPTGVTKEDAEAIAAAAAAGGIITTVLDVQAVQNPDDAAAIQKAAGEATVAQYVDAEILVQADGEPIGHITQTEEPIELAVTLSQEELDKGLIFFVVRSHEGKTDILPVRLDKNVLSFSTDKFSTFGVAYTDDIRFAQVDPIPDQKWTGSEVKPKVKVTANGVELKEGTDYEIKYENNTNASDKAKVIITGKAPYTGSLEVTFKVVKAAASGGAPLTGDGQPLALYAAAMAVSLAGLGLTLGRKRREQP